MIPFFLDILRKCPSDQNNKQKEQVSDSLSETFTVNHVHVP